MGINQFALASHPHLNERMEKTTQYNDHGKQAQPGSFRLLPAICVDYFRLVIGFQTCCFCLEFTISYCQIIGLGTGTCSLAKDDIIADGGCDEDPLPIHRRELFVR